MMKQRSIHRFLPLIVIGLLFVLLTTAALLLPYRGITSEMMVTSESNNNIEIHNWQDEYVTCYWSDLDPKLNCFRK